MNRLFNSNGFERKFLLPYFLKSKKQSDLAQVRSLRFYTWNRSKVPYQKCPAKNAHTKNPIPKPPKSAITQDSIQSALQNLFSKIQKMFYNLEA